MSGKGGFPEYTREISNKICIKTAQVRNMVMLKKCALVIGHKRTSPGNRNHLWSVSEFGYNDELARRVATIPKLTLVQRVYRRTFEMLPRDVNRLRPDFVVSMHCNAFDQNESGTEILYYHKSEMGRRIAEIMQHYIVECLNLPNRGLRPMDAEDRCGYLLRYSEAPAIVVEPFFIDNDDDCRVAIEMKDGLVHAYSRAIDDITQMLYDLDRQ